MRSRHLLARRPASERVLHFCIDCGDLRWGLKYCYPCSLDRAKRLARAMTCERCGFRYKSHPENRYCSWDCESADRQEREAAALPAIERMYALLSRPGAKPCWHCGTPVPPNRKRFCSPKCTSSYHSHVHDHFGQYTTPELFSHWAIYDREGWRCYVCHELLNPELRGQKKYGPALDHLVPRLHPLYPGHVQANLVVVHARCNASKNGRFNRRAWERYQELANDPQRRAGGTWVVRRVVAERLAGDGVEKPVDRAACDTSSTEEET